MCKGEKSAGDGESTVALKPTDRGIPTQKQRAPVAQKMDLGPTKSSKCKI